uniref:Uncharacterized protein n=1 Tax=Leptocylindrus danicus TaxID=163516 RepID=A0A7S2KUI0_9STRA|mmetsp:Transcript_26630/g.39503  ORF Transcript_26630/g.39503 Transcript_26630/m.39503 type:complete len:147 (+) Transcript_26630:177-617(+)|eukprot:CAMPEP_0116035608 /NCGR_PEP_ID=MMETSP0321-20121206/20501_1 /TAXON_ID=163516 /ORGANISM="Leptocylindrus danicus var. danicus, Strain B650" /LENGTH=146 /DNA_ID=CAMNT_0003512537 /DNA_START=154 /DNA_END=594 /DNA_ORIENTATION=-
MASRTQKLVRAFKTASSVVYALSILSAGMFAFHNFYLETLSGALVVAICLVMLVATTDQPRPLAERLSNSRYEFVYSFRGRVIMDVIASLFLFAFGGLGFVLATIMLGIVLGIFICGMQLPELIHEMFLEPGTSPECDESASYSRT